MGFREIHLFGCWEFLLLDCGRSVNQAYFGFVSIRCWRLLQFHVVICCQINLFVAYFSKKNCFRTNGLIFYGDLFITKALVNI